MIISSYLRAAILSSFLVATVGYSESLLRIQLTDFSAQMKALSTAGYDIAGVNLDDGTVDVIVDGSEKGDLLRSLGNVTYELAQKDAKKIDDRYMTYGEATGAIRAMAAEHRDIAALERIGTSHENRDIWAIKITDNPLTRELDEPTILFNGNHHAREVMTVEVMVDTVEYLLENYGKDATVTHWVDNNEIWVVPVVNPDGNMKVWNSNSWWRKNTREGHGVDLNRNYPFNWDFCNGSSGSTGSDTYRGPSPGSEPEAQAIMGLVDRIQPVFDISYHSYSELVIYPYGCSNQVAPTKEILEEVGGELANQLPKDSGNGFYEPGTAPELLYSADGGDIDWMYGVHDVIAFVIELNASSQGFQPGYSWRQPTCEKMRDGWGYLMDRLEGSGVRGVIRGSAGEAQSNVTLTLTTLGDRVAAVTTHKAKADGTYHIVLKPGMYSLSFDWDGQRETREFTIGADRVNLDIQF